MIIAIIIISMFAAFFIMLESKAKNIGSISGAEYDYLTIGDYRYERTEDAPVSRTDKGKLLGTATDGDTRFYIYAVKRGTMNISIAAGNGKDGFTNSRTQNNPRFFTFSSLHSPTMISLDVLRQGNGRISFCHF